MRKTSHRKKLYGFKRNRPNPASYAQDLIKQHTAVDALKLAQNVLGSVKKALAGGNIMEHSSMAELKRNEGFWQSVAGYVRKRQ